MSNRALNTDHLHFDSTSVLAEVRRVSCLGIGVNFLLAAMKLFAGFVGHSSVLIADGVNSLSDMITGVVVLVGSRFWGQPADEDHPYGHAKIETLITLFIGVSVFLVGIGLVYEAVETLVQLAQGQQIVSPTVLPLVIASLAILIKYGLYRRFLYIGMKIKSTAVIANARDYQSDMLASLPAVVAVSFCLLLGNSYAFLDPVGAIVVSVMIMYASWDIVRPTFRILLDGGASHEQYRQIADTILLFAAVKNFEKLKTRHIGPTALAVMVHVRVDGTMSVNDSHELTRQISQKLVANDPNIIEVTIHIEPDAQPR